MNLLTTLLLATAASAAPLEKMFNLVTSGAPTSSNNDLYVTTESTGPLNSNAVLSTKADAASFYFSNGTVHYEAPNGAPWAMALVSGSEYENPVEISVDPTTGSDGFKVAASGTLSVAQPSWGGWLICTGGSDPAVYYVNTKATSGALKAGCEKVQLKAVLKPSS
ncbi:hypothetical protein N7448_002378 [Penicillium atrosanguineum]|uniref:DUF7907 domain-containing protein n=1 Tax=Penicillium atrosanguineum TaxID=1132637 RepID=A0A9W9LAN5_9EURO|nr:hypothetical protein N7526_006827 [Penicillium atrosanguineum]KAJ5144986.1 hypothetical protein N7448_002378 [Penicillium atrosanguineum]KAJ5311420.1 hypothetical protein N7476_007280 [Penicillium atrosanguineum]